MSTPEANTKIERVVEAFEDFMIATITAHVTKPGANSYTVLRAARDECSAALREFLRPVLRRVQ